MAFQIAAAAALVIWIYLLIGRGGFWWIRAEIRVATVPSPAPRVGIVIPARNEAGGIGRAIASLAAQQYPGDFEIVVVDDDSSDGTAEAARAVPAGNLTVIAGKPLPPQWTGKLWAVSQGVRHALRHAPDYLLLTDADIVHPPDNLSFLVTQAAAGYDLVSLMARLHCQTTAERALMPAFVFFFFLLYPPAWVRNRRFRTAGAAGGCLLIRRQTLERIGGIVRVRTELIDDCALARAVKRSGGRIWLGPSSATESLREYRTCGEIGRMISRTAFTQLRHSWWLLAATVAGLLFTYGAPPLTALSGQPAGALAWILMALVYLPVLRFYNRSPLWAPCLPLIAFFYAAATVHSAIVYQRGTGGMWKGRAQAARN